MRFRFVFFALFAVICLYGQGALAEIGKPFYGKLDVGVQSKEAFIEKLNSFNNHFRVPLRDLLVLVNRNLGTDIESLDEFIKFIRSPEVEVALCDWLGDEKNVKISAVGFRPGLGLTYASNSRFCYDNEHVLKFQKKVFLSLACGNPVRDERPMFYEKKEPPVLSKTMIEEKKTAKVEVLEMPIMKTCHRKEIIVLQKPNKVFVNGIWGASGAGFINGNTYNSSVTQTEIRCVR